MSCQKDEEINEKATFVLLDPSVTGVSFINQITETKEMNMLNYRNFYNGGGVAAGDINNDGLIDLYFTANQTENKLYLNKGNLKFEDITESSGTAGTKAWSTGVSMADVNGDGLLDIYVCNSGNVGGTLKENELFINNGDLTFTEQAQKYHLNNAGYGTHAAFFDYDADGDLDCYLLNNSFKEPGKIELYRSMRDIPDATVGDKLMRNDGDVFTDVTKFAGIYSSAIGFGLGVATSDLNNDGWPDLYISNDFWERDYLYFNNGNGTFREVLTQNTDYVSTSSMGADIADINGDGYPDIFTTDMLAAEQLRLQSMMIFEPFHIEDLKYRANYHYQYTQNCLQLNDGTGQFQEIAHLANVGATDWSWGSLIFDFQNDGSNDIFVANGIAKDILDGDFREFMDEKNQKENFLKDSTFDTRQLTKEMPSSPLTNYAFVNQNNLNFKNEASALGLGQKTFSNGSVYADLDNDGDLDLILNNNNEHASIYKNQTSDLAKAHYLELKFESDDKNRFGVGVKVIAEYKDKKWVKENFTNRGFQSSISPELTFGLGEVGQLDKLTIIWTDGSYQIKTNVKTNARLTIKKAEAAGKWNYKFSSPTLWTDITSQVLPSSAVHIENEFNDFNQEILLNRMLSTDSPRLIKADVNRDGQEDFLLLGARNDPDKLFIQNNGKFFHSDKSVFDQDKGFESTCAGFLDFEGDGDLDLLIAAGGNEPAEAINFIVRLYINDGHGHFQVDPNGIPPVVGNFSTLEVADFDKDGRTDIFLGGRCVVGSYGLIPKSYLIKNNGGAWQDVSPAFLNDLGMVTDATWADYDSDGLKDLLVVGDWMAVKVLKNSGNSLQSPFEVKNSSGWWTRIEAADLDQDGDLDFVLGNWGENSKFKTTADLPIEMKVADFDGNGKSEFVINWKPFDNEELYPWPSRVELTSQLPFLKKEKVKFNDFAKRKFVDLFPNPPEQIISYKAETLSTSVLWNEKGEFELTKLPIEAQFAPIFGIVIEDFDKDGEKDIFLVGNFYGLKPQLGRQAASRGLLLSRRKAKTYQVNQLSLKGEYRDAILVSDILLLARNSASMQAFRMP